MTDEKIIFQAGRYWVTETDAGYGVMRPLHVHGARVAWYGGLTPQNKQLAIAKCKAVAEAAQ